MMIPESFMISESYLPGNTPSPLKSRETTEKRFPLEGLQGDIFQAVDPGPYASSGPVYPTIGTKLFPLLDVLAETIGKLGKHPTPEEVDRSNVRRIIRAFEPIAEAYAGSYDSKAHEKALERLITLASRLGSYKDVSVIESELREIPPGGEIKRSIKHKLAKEREARKEKLDEEYGSFRRKGLDKVTGVFSYPAGIEHLSPEKILRNDRKIMAGRIHELAADTQSTGLIHQDPEKFHDSRKVLRKLLYSLDASSDLFGLTREELAPLKSQIDCFGVAQDSFTAFKWLDKRGFKKEAEQVYQRYRAKQQEALDMANKLIESGCIEKILEKV